jgi:two-component system sensor histidine kinase MprB
VTNAVAELAELTHLVDEIVDLAAGASADAPFEPCALDDVVARVVARTRRRTPSTIELTAAPCTVSGRPARLERAIGNLLDNARKWSPPDAPIEVRVEAGRVSVRDHGPGVPPEERTRVFGRFARGAAVEGVPGSGLGLAIVADVAREHGGRAWLDAPADGGGTVAVLEVPVLPEHIN